MFNLAAIYFQLGFFLFLLVVFPLAVVLLGWLRFCSRICDSGTAFGIIMWWRFCQRWEMMQLLPVGLVEQNKICPPPTEAPGEASLLLRTPASGNPLSTQQRLSVLVSGNTEFVSHAHVAQGSPELRGPCSPEDLPLCLFCCRNLWGSFPRTHTVQERGNPRAIWLCFFCNKSNKT